MRPAMHDRARAGHAVWCNSSPVFVIPAPRVSLRGDSAPALGCRRVKGRTPRQRIAPARQPGRKVTSQTGEKFGKPTRYLRSSPRCIYRSCHASRQRLNDASRSVGRRGLSTVSSAHFRGPCVCGALLSAPPLSRPCNPMLPLRFDLCWSAAARSVLFTQSRL